MQLSAALWCTGLMATLLVLQGEGTPLDPRKSLGDVMLPQPTSRGFFRLVRATEPAVGPSNKFWCLGTQLISVLESGQGYTPSPWRDSYAIAQDESWMGLPSMPKEFSSVVWGQYPLLLRPKMLVNNEDLQQANTSIVTASLRQTQWRLDGLGYVSRKLPVRVLKGRNAGAKWRELRRILHVTHRPEQTDNGRCRDVPQHEPLRSK